MPKDMEKQNSESILMRTSKPRIDDFATALYLAFLQAICTILDLPCCGFLPFIALISGVLHSVALTISGPVGLNELWASFYVHMH